jgi:hypothetical protein
MLEIVTPNIEGIKGNSPYLKHLGEENRILCLQKHWLHGYEINTIQGILSGFDFNISCFDDEQSFRWKPVLSKKNNCSLPHLYETFDFLHFP